MTKYITHFVSSKSQPDAEQTGSLAEVSDGGWNEGAGPGTGRTEGVTIFGVSEIF